MTLTLTSSSGVPYPLWQLPDLSAPTPKDEIEFTTLENEMSQGYRETALFGLDTGLRRWRLSLPTLAGTNVPVPTVTDPYSATVTREQYIRNLRQYNYLTGSFVYQCPNNNRYYLVDFANDPLTMKRAKNINIYSTDITLEQRRINGITFVDNQVWTYGHNFGDEADSFGDVTSTTQNGKTAYRLNNTLSTGYLQKIHVGGLQHLTFYDIFLVMKVREATFSNNAGILTSKTAGEERLLVGTSSGTKFQNLSLTDFEYRLNGVLYAATNQQAPMNTWGVVHLRFKSGVTLSSDWQIGRDRATAGTYAKIDLGEFWFGNGGALGRFGTSAGLLPMEEIREAVEGLAIKWGIVL